MAGLLDNVRGLIGEVGNTAEQIFKTAGQLGIKTPSVTQSALTAQATQTQAKTTGGYNQVVTVGLIAAGGLILLLVIKKLIR